MKNLCILITLFVVATASFAQDKNYNISKSDDIITVDGNLNEFVWQNVPMVDDFVQNFPADSIDATAKTEVYMTYDDKMIYIAARCYNEASDEYVVNSLVRDYSFPKTDAFAVFLSPNQDKTNGVSFSVNPYGVQREGIVANAGNYGVTTAWDNKWFSACNRDNSDFWTLEMAIPFKTLRYDAKSTTWDINFARNDLQLNEQSVWSPVPLGYNVARLDNCGTLTFDNQLTKAGANIAIIPYMKIGAEYQYEDGEIVERNNLSDAGLDAKIGITSTLNLDLTINPDFSNVQVDEQVINLDRFDISLPERRTFFTENSDLFANFGFSKIRPFFSRRIGLSQGQNVPILGGLRLSGNVTENTRVGLMSIQTEGVGGDAQLESQNYTVAAFQQQVFETSNIGAILVNRQAFNKFKTIDDNNLLVGLDYNLYSKNGKWRGKAFYHQTFEDSLEIDGGAQAVWLNYRDTDWDFHYNHEYVGANYNADVGFVPRTGYFRFEHIASRFFYPDRREKINRLEVGAYYSQYWVKDKISTDRDVTMFGHLTFSNTSKISVEQENIQTRLQSEFDLIDKGTPFEIGNYKTSSIFLSYESDFRKAFAYYASAKYGGFYNGNKLTYRAGADYRVRPWASIGLDFQRNEIRFSDDNFENGYLTLIGGNIQISFSNKVLWNTFLQYNTQANNFNINSRLQWRFAPQSDIFVVYTDNYTDDFKPKNKAFVLRINYWFGL
ncbi:MAG: DUF5916 domain-containing protein [Chitinophagales bacterium]